MRCSLLVAVLMLLPVECRMSLLRRLMQQYNKKMDKLTVGQRCSEKDVSKFMRCF